MVKIVNDNIEEIIKLCEKMHVQSLYLFGSGSNKTRYKKNSDLDFIYRFKKNKDGLTISEYDYFDLLFDLEKITGKKVDLVSEEKITNKFFIKSVNLEKIKLYGS